MIIGPWFVGVRWLHVNAITLYPFIIVRSSVKRDERVRRHELIHIWQVRKVGWFRFYLTYLRDAMRHTYREIPAEVEAYAHDKDPKYLPTQLERLVAK